MSKMLKTLTILVFLLLQLSLFAQKTLYKISGNGLDKASYLYGTIHLIPKSDFNFSSELKAIISSCEALVLEMKLEFSKEDKKKMGEEMIIPKGKTIKDLMDENAYNAIKSFAQDSLGIGDMKWNFYERIQPTYLSGILIKEGIGASTSFEEEFKKYADKKKMKFDALETLEEQINYFKMLSIDQQLDGLNDSVLIDYQLMLNIYLHQSVDSLFNYMASIDEAGFNELNNKLIMNRNKNWIPKMEKLCKSQSNFIAVGAAHLGGYLGIIKLLRIKGYSVKQVDL